MNWNPAQQVYEQARRTPHNLALDADDVQLDYAQLILRAHRLAASLRAHGIGRGSRVGILASRSRIAVEAVLGIAWTGAAYVPLGLRWPEARIEAALTQAAPAAVIADAVGTRLLTIRLLERIPLLFVPGADRVPAAALPSTASVEQLDALPAIGDPTPPEAMQADDLAYLIFTSGTTGVPKGVMVATGSVAAYLSALGARKAMTASDRASQFTELSFDPSLGEIFLPWYVGASLHVVPAVSQVSPAKFIRDHALTIWGSAPAAIAWMRDTRSLRPGAFPLLRYSSFGGEPLTLAAVQAWQAAAPNSVVDNLYGPTEATVDCVGQRVEPASTPVVTPGRGVLAIGKPHPGTELAVFDEALSPVPLGQSGELAIAGGQLSLGYLGLEQTTAERFPVIAGKRWYLTGDIAMQDAAGNFHHLGRIDNQIKLHGHRVELEDIEAHARAVAGTDQVAAVAWPYADGVATAITCFVAGSPQTPNAIRESLRARLPAYMVPSSVRVIEALPLNSNGKLDRNALTAVLDRESTRSA